MKRFFLSGALILAFLLSACVGKNTYEQKVNEADQLTKDVAQLNAIISDLQADKAQLEKEKSDLNDRVVEVLQQNSKLQRNLLAANAEQERKEGDISRHQQRINALQDQLTDMQQTNDNLLATIEERQAQIDELKHQVEKERIAKEARLAKVKNTYDQLVNALEDEIKRGELTISNLEGQLSVNLQNKILFDSGRAVIKKEGQVVLQSLGDVLNKFPDKSLLIEGHTDNVGISSRLIEKFPTNWELSTARATSVVHFLQDTVGLPGDRLGAAGYSQYRPIASNGEKEGKALNRRIQILLVPYKAAAAE